MFDVLLSAISELKKRDQNLSDNYKNFQTQYQKFIETSKDFKDQKNNQLFGLPYKKS